MRMLRLALGVALLLAGPSAFAQEQGHIVLSTVAEQEITVTGENGVETVERVPASKVVPGNVVIYTITARNVSDDPVDKVVITDPIPKHMTYTAGTAEGMHTEVRFSADGGETYAFAADLQIIGEDGQPRRAVAEDYTHIRWHFTVSIEPDQDHSVQFRAKLN